MALDRGENPGMGSAYKIPVWLLFSPSKNIEGQFVDVPTGDSGFFFFLKFLPAQWVISGKPLNLALTEVILFFMFKLNPG